MDITKATARVIRKDLDAALEEIGKKHGLQMVTGLISIDYTGKTAAIKVKASVIESDGSVVTEEALALKTHGQDYGLSEDHLGVVFWSNGTQYKFLGLNTRAPKYPILAEVVNTGQGVRFQKGIVKTILQAHRLAA